MRACDKSSDLVMEGFLEAVHWSEIRGLEATWNLVEGACLCAGNLGKLVITILEIQIL